MTKTNPTPTSESLRDDFTLAMSAHAAGIAIITVAADERPMGLAVTSLISYSASPPSIAFALDQGSRSGRHLVSCERFGVHLLAQDRDAVASSFASRADDKFAGLSWRWQDGVPLLNDCGDVLVCEREATFEHGDHSIVIGAVRSLARDPERRPLVFWQRQFGWDLTLSPARL